MTEKEQSLVDQIEVIVEIPSGSRNKYEMDHKTGVIKLDRVLYSSVHYPTDYGFIPNSLSLDGDPLDVLVIMHEPTFPGCHVMVRPIGVLRMHDEKGGDDKILAVPVADPRFNEVHELADVGSHWLKEIENFFATYKTLQGLGADIDGWRGRADAWLIIEEALRAGAEAHH